MPTTLVHYYFIHLDNAYPLGFVLLFPVLDDWLVFVPIDNQWLESIENPMNPIVA
jgi:hypothetical protein